VKIPADDHSNDTPSKISNLKVSFIISQNNNKVPKDKKVFISRFFTTYLKNLIFSLLN